MKCLAIWDKFMGKQLFLIVHTDLLITVPQRLIADQGVCGCKSLCTRLLLKFNGTELSTTIFLLVIFQHSLLEVYILYVMLFTIHKLQYFSSDELEICQFHSCGTWPNFMTYIGRMPCDVSIKMQVPSLLR